MHIKQPSKILYLNINILYFDNNDQRYGFKNLQTKLDLIYYNTYNACKRMLVLYLRPYSEQMARLCKFGFAFNVHIYKLKRKRQTLTKRKELKMCF